MDQRESDPTGAFSGGGSARLDDEGTEYGRHAPDGADAGGGRPNTGSTGPDSGGQSDGDAEREAVVGGTAATSELADRDAQEAAEARGDGTPQPR